MLTDAQYELLRAESSRTGTSLGGSTLPVDGSIAEEAPLSHVPGVEAAVVM